VGWIDLGSELTWALILASARHLAREAGSVRDGGWQTGIGANLRGNRHIDQPYRRLHESELGGSDQSRGHPTQDKMNGHEVGLADIARVLR
jgi:hypothetical protein